MVLCRKGDVGTKPRMFILFNSSPPENTTKCPPTGEFFIARM